MTGSGGMRQDELAAEYTRIRPRLLRAAYAMLGTWADAEDVVADCWLRLAAADQRDPVADIEAWAVVAVSRRALDVPMSAHGSRSPSSSGCRARLARMAWGGQPIWPTRPTG
jgi:DNA-directed RNA polymerase specialized sigma24 family protein